MRLKNEISKKISAELKDKIADFAYKKGKKKLGAKAYSLKGIKFYDDNTASVEFSEVPDVGEYIGYGKWAAMDASVMTIIVTKKELYKLF